MFLFIVDIGEFKPCQLVKRTYQALIPQCRHWMCELAGAHFNPVLPKVEGKRIQMDPGAMVQL